MEWMSDGWIYAVRDESDAQNTFVRFSPNHEDDEPIELTIASCPTPGPVSVSRLSDSSVALAVRCIEVDGTLLVAYDLGSRTATTMARVDFDVEGMAWSSD